MQNDIVKEMRDGLEDTTPGQWVAQHQRGTPSDIGEYLEVAGDSTVSFVVGPDGICKPSSNDRSFTEDNANMRHIARCSPANILALLTRLETAERERDEARAANAWKDTSPPTDGTRFLAWNPVVGIWNTAYFEGQFPCGFWDRPGAWYPGIHLWRHIAVPRSLSPALVEGETATAGDIGESP